MRSRAVSTVPYIIVALERRPIWWADAHDAEPLVARALGLGDLAAHAVDEDLGARRRGRCRGPPRAGARGRRARSGPRGARCGGSPPARARAGPSRYSRFIQRKRSSYHSMRSSGCSPPCRRICTPPASTTSCSFSPELLAREHVALGVAERAVEGAEAAARRAHVRVVDVAIDDVRHDVVRVLAPAHRVGGEPEVEERCLRDQALALGGAQALALCGAREQAVERRRPEAALAAVLVVEADARAREQPCAARPRRRIARGRGARRRRGRSGWRRAGTARSEAAGRPVRAACSSAMASRRSRPGEARPLEEALVVRPRARPARPHHAAKTKGRPGRLPPGEAEVEHVREAALDLERGIADDERPARSRRRTRWPRAGHARRAAARGRSRRARRTRRARTTLVRDERSTASSSMLLDRRARRR